MRKFDKELFEGYERWAKRKQKLVKIGKSGKIYIPKLIRELFKDCYFFVLVSEGKIILDPVKIDFKKVDENEA